MNNLQKQRSDETKMQILNAAEKLFAKKRYDAVSIREIAKIAGCSHTTIYLYFEDKEALLHALSMPSLQTLYDQLKKISQLPSLSSEDKLKALSREYLQFCLQHRSMYDIFFNAKSTRVDDEKPELEINKLRLKLFDLMKFLIQNCLSISEDKQLLEFTRIYYFQLNGILNTYTYPHEPIDSLLKRLTPTFNLSIEILILGFKEKLRGGEE